MKAGRRDPSAMRLRAIRRTESMLRRRGRPRLEMMLLVALTGLAGLLASFSLLRLGVETMAVRYPIAVALAYLVFLGLMWVWLRARRDDLADLLDLMPTDGVGAVLDAVPVPGSRLPSFGGGGGRFGGGGASGSFETPGVGDAVGAVLDTDEGAVPVVVIGLVILFALGLLIACGYVVYIAPALFAEVLVDGILSVVLFRHLRAAQRPSWHGAAVRGTILPFVATAVFLCAVGYAMAVYAPGARSIGEVLEHAQRGSAASCCHAALRARMRGVPRQVVAGSALGRDRSRSGYIRPDRSDLAFGLTGVLTSARTSPGARWSRARQ
ncbi:MAG: hypothetical protein ACK5PW_15675 [Burkholderiales bacterium]